MGKDSDIAELAEELKRCGEKLVDISKCLAELVSNTEKNVSANNPSTNKKKEQKPKQSEKRTISIEEVRMVMAEKSRAGFTDEIRSIIAKHGADRLSDIDPTEFETILAEAKVIGDA